MRSSDAGVVEDEVAGAEADSGDEQQRDHGGDASGAVSDHSDGGRGEGIEGIRGESCVLGPAAPQAL